MTSSGAVDPAGPSRVLLPQRALGWLRGPGSGLLLALAVCLPLALFATDPAWRDPGQTMVCAVVHPDCAGNQWLLAWVAERVMSLEGLFHNDRYYWPVGDAPFLAGNGGEGIPYLPFHLLFGWPAGATIYLTLLLAFNGLAGFYAARSAGAGVAGSLVAAATITSSIYTLQELSSGRFTQADIGWMLLFLGSWLRFLAAPSTARALGSAALLAVTSALYWYHGFFMVLAGAILLALHRWEGRLPWRRLLLFAGAYLLLIAGPLSWFLMRWAELPGATEPQFPHPEAIADSMDPALPFLIDGGRFVGQALPALVVLLAMGSAVKLLLRRSDRPRLDLALLLLYGIFFALALGPRFLDREPAPFNLLYGLAGPLRRFWWPSRHIIVANVCIILLAARAVPALGARRDALLGLGLAALIPLNLAIQGVSPQARVTRMTWPPPFYEALRGAPGTLLLDLPIAAQASVSERPVLYQLAHGKTLINGHAQWVHRVRPPEWDAFVAGNSFLSALKAKEEGDEREEFTFRAQDLIALREQGLGVISLNAEHYPLPLAPCMNAEQQALVGLFGRPISKMQRGWAWSTWDWNGKTRVDASPCVWPQNLPTDGVAPRTPRTFQSNIFHAVRDGWILRKNEGKRENP